MVGVRVGGKVFSKVDFIFILIFYFAKVFATSKGNKIVASPKTFIASPLFCWIFPHETASSGLALESAPFLIRFALQIWCFIIPFPRIIIPVFFLVVVYSYKS